MRSRARPRALWAGLAACALSALGGAARAAGPPAAGPPRDGPPAERPPADGWSPSLVLATGRVPFPAPDPRALQLGLHGEYQLRVLGATDLPLDPPLREPTAEASELGQNARVEHWLRLRVRADMEDDLALVGEIDLPRGFVGGDRTRHVTAARDPFSEPNGLTVQPRQLFVEARTPIGLLRLGQQTSTWGMGLLANDGDTPSLFGDYRRGDLVERILFATKPLGAEHPFVIAVGGDVVFEDDLADLLDDEDLVTQGVIALAWRDRPAELGVYGVVRHHERDRPSVSPAPAFTEELTVFALDVAGRFHAPVPGARAFVYGDLEAALILGETDFVRTQWVGLVDPAASLGVKESVEQMGGAMRLGIVHVAPEDAWERRRPPGAGAPFGDAAVEVELGWASGDADPADGVSRRFVFDANHNVGLVLFDHVLAWKTARAATNAQDPRLVGRAPPGVDLLPSDGGVFGATYLNPRFIVRPRPFLDLKAGLLVAQATSDVVDPYRFGALGSARNWDGGDPDRRDLGVEIDAGTEVRFPIGAKVTAQLGAEGGILFPGGAFDDAGGGSLPTQGLGQVEAGLQF